MANKRIGKKNKEQALYLKIEELKKGDVYGLKEMILRDSNGHNSTMLISDGAECILLKRKDFMKGLSKKNQVKLQIALVPYPTDETLATSYYYHESWKLFKKQNFEKFIIKHK